MIRISMEQAEKDFQGLLSRVQQGEVFLISRDGEAVGKLEPVMAASSETKGFRIGMLEGQGIVPDDIKTPYEEEISEMFHCDAVRVEEGTLTRTLTERPLHPRIGFLKGRGSVPANWKELGREEIERDFYGE